MSAVSIQAPVGGWNARDSLAEMPITDAVELINLVPNGDSIRGRMGYAAHSTTLGAAVQTIVAYHGATEKLLCAAGGKIINITTAGGAGTNLGTGFSVNKWYTTEFKNRIIFCNGTDAVQDWDGTTLTATSITGATSTDLIFPVTHKGRVLYVEDASQSFWYPAAGAYAGAMTEFDLSEFTTTGGTLLTLISWTRDGGSGVDDLLACLFDTGEIIVYAGSDPGSATDWNMLGRFRIGRPLGRRCATKLGGDVIILTVDGYVPLSAALQEGRYSEQSDFSFKIDKAAKDAAQAYKDQFGWEAIHWPQASWFVVNVPISANESVQHVRNTTKGGWCKFEDVDASCWALYDDNLYFGSPDGFVYKMAGKSDNGAFIRFRCKQAFTYFGNPHRKKQVVACEPVTNFNYPKYFSLNMHVDFQFKLLGEVTNPPEGAISEWNVGEWDVAQWGGDSRGPALTVRRNMTGTGYALAFDMRWNSKAQSVTWWSTSFWLNEIGIV